MNLAPGAWYRKRVMVFWDTENCRIPKRIANHPAHPIFPADYYAALRSYCVELAGGHPAFFRIYAGLSQSANVSKEMRESYAALQEYVTFLHPLGKRSQRRRHYPDKDRVQTPPHEVDSHLQAQMRYHLQTYADPKEDVILILTGDGDYTASVKALIDHGLSVYLLSNQTPSRNFGCAKSLLDLKLPRSDWVDFSHEILSHYFHRHKKTSLPFALQDFIDHCFAQGKRSEEVKQALPDTDIAEVEMELVTTLSDTEPEPELASDWVTTDVMSDVPMSPPLPLSPRPHLLSLPYGPPPGFWGFPPPSSVKFVPSPPPYATPYGRALLPTPALPFIPPFGPRL